MDTKNEKKPTKKSKKEGVIEKLAKEEKKIKKRTLTLRTEFQKFIKRGNVIDLAIAVVIGTAFNGIVNGLVAYIITPLIGLFAGGIDMKQWKIVLKEATEATETMAAKPELAVMYGAFLQTIFDFLIIALCLFMGLRIVTIIKNRIWEKELEAKKIADEKKKAEDKIKEEQAKEAAAKKAEIESNFYTDISTQTKLLGEILEKLNEGK